jgi:hypothetical protein
MCILEVTDLPLKRVITDVIMLPFLLSLSPIITGLCKLFFLIYLHLYPWKYLKITYFTMLLNFSLGCL